MSSTQAVQPAKRPRLRLSRANREPASRLYRMAAMIAHIGLTPLGRRDWRQTWNLPASGGIIVVCNHISRFDPVPLGDYLIWSGRWPRYLAKTALFKSKLIGWLLRATESVPVDRSSPRASEALVPARERLARGKAVLIYPEGTETHDPDIWPMVARTGAARLALETRAPVIPCAQWGAHRLLPPSPGLPRKIWGGRFSIVCGQPVDLSQFYGLETTREVLEVATVKIMDAITELLA
ncbi:MAG: 1-acyl-sn-glycerol-3-phosphate acyltransferase [Propionibacteriaceae bacterium]|nr:1-acyl-sn-glycerol-3-phosphate acyltransferase [Propionibacteriaceae bacterium]